MIRLGYVSYNTQLPLPNKTFRLSNYSDEKMLQVAQSNINALRTILLWNKEHSVHFFRITSQLIPFGSHPINKGKWKELLQEQLEEIGEIINRNKMRVSMHPGQYTVLNTPHDSYYKNSLRDLEYHTSLLELMGLDSSHTIVIHGGGAYGDKSKSLSVLCERINNLSSSIKNRLILENDDKIFNAQDIFTVCEKTNIPGVLDVFHHEVLPSYENFKRRDLILLYKKTWPQNERQKIHYSTQEQGKIAGTHAQKIDLLDFSKFYEEIKDLDLDIMLEIKDKENSLLKIRNSFPSIQ